MKDRIVIANAGGYWGDEAAAVTRQVRGGHIDYLTMDYLAEITMIILARQKHKSEEAGYASDFIAHVGSVLDDLAAGEIRVIANAGGINPGACARALESMMEQRGISLPVAVVDGDDLMPDLESLVSGGAAFEHIDSGQALGSRLPRVNTANAYLGAQPIVAALEGGARIVITGRTYDAASVVAPMVYEFGWDWDDYDRLASALVAGHLLECGAQSTGGNYSLWTEVPSHTNMGYPLVEAAADGSFVLTKHPGTGGLVSRRTAIEQVLYEIGDPRAYASPDVVADFTSFEISDDGQNRVRVEGVRGGPPTDKLKVSVTFEDGFKCVAMVVVSGPQAVAKARKFAEIFWQRLDGPFTETRTELIGHSACWGESASPPVEPNEVVLRLGARAETQEPLLAAARAVAGIALGGPPGICGAGSRPQVSPAYGFWPALVDRRLVVGRMFMGGSSQQFPCGDARTVAFKPGQAAEPDQAAEPGSATGDDRRGGDRRVRVPLSRIAHSRSGDKADTCNLGVAALRPEFYPELLREVTAERVAAWFSSLVKGPVTRYRLDNLDAVNFVMQRSLGGGGTVSLQLDSQGKTFAQGILAMEVEIAAELADSL